MTIGKKRIFTSPVFNVQEIDTVLQTADYQSSVYRRQRQNAFTVNVGDKHDIPNYRLSTLYV
jgi:hypothetical protein